MKIKVFKIRLSEDFQEPDEKLVNSFLTQNNVIKTSTNLINGTENYWSVLVFYEDQPTMVKERSGEKYSAGDEELSESEIQILQSLKLWRSEKAKEQMLPPYFIATNKELVSITKFKPLKKEELMEIRGFGKHKIENFGDEIIEILESV